MTWLIYVLTFLVGLWLIACGFFIGLGVDMPPKTRVEVRIESPYPDFTCQEDELMVWVDRSNRLARCVNIEEFEAAL